MSRFKGILNAAKNREPSPEPEPATFSPLPPDPVALPDLSERSSFTKRGRPRGKRSDPDYEQVTAYIRSQTYRNVKIALLQRGDERNFSDLVEELLSEWVNG